MTTINNPEADNAISAAAAAITAPTPHDPAGMLHLAASIRQQITAAKTDPKHIAYGNQAAIDAMERNLAIGLARGNVAEPVFDPKAAALAAHDAAFSLDLHPNLIAMVDARLDAMSEQHDEGALTAMAGALRVQLGGPEYDLLVEQAKASLNPGEILPATVKADPIVLNLLAGVGRYHVARERTRPRS